MSATARPARFVPVAVLEAGCVYAVDATYAYILTNHHVAGGPGTRVTVTFVARGFSSNPLPAETVWHSFSPSHHRDMAVVRVPLASFGSRVPKPIPLAKPGYRVKPGQTITTVGCPNAQWPSARVGHADSVESDIIVFTPAAIPGQSGSAIFDETGSFIVGLIAWSDGGHGIGMTSDEIWKASRGEGPTLYRMKGVQPAALEDVQCPDGNCAPGRMPSHPPSGGINPFPGLPDDEPIRPAPTVPINPPKVEPPADGCKCENDKLAILIAGQDARLTAIETLIAKLAEREPQKGECGPAGEKGPQGEQGPAGSSRRSANCGTGRGRDEQATNQAACSRDGRRSEGIPRRAASLSQAVPNHSR
jgi:hypothetical protein